MASKSVVVFIDLSGTLHIGDQPTRDAAAALERLRKRPEVAILFVSNTTKETTNRLHKRLVERCHLDIKREELFTSLSAARRYVDEHHLRPMLLLADEAVDEFDGVDASEPLNAVVVGLAPKKFDFPHMNRAFRLLLHDNARLVATHKARYFQGNNGLELGPGPFVEALEFATGKTPEVVGKPSKAFFEDALEHLRSQHPKTDFSWQRAWMIGDDAVDDVRGATDVGMWGILVRTGKYREGDDEKLDSLHGRSHVSEDFAAAVDHLITQLDAQ